ncbi:hypothetical protein A2U01_0110125, partial [Trifolium medium]|nr:hypothetical protein [Trifolium medium]
LKPCLDAAAEPLGLPLETEGKCPLIRPLAVLDWKTGTDTEATQVLIQWECLFPEDATWEDYEDIRVTYPE